MAKRDWKLINILITTDKVPITTLSIFDFIDRAHYEASKTGILYFPYVKSFSLDCL